jgi:hypothetical protein
VHPLLDLHGLTADAACQRAGAWLRGRQAEGYRTVVVVTGRGLHSRGAPVLRGEIEHVLRGLRDTLVEAWRDAPGGGGFEVELKRLPPPRPRPRTPAPRAHDPALRRRAEEALWELGVTPTPELLDAEIRRLLRVMDGGE